MLLVHLRHQQSKIVQFRMMDEWWSESDGNVRELYW